MMCEYCEPYKDNKELIRDKINTAYIYGGDRNYFSLGFVTAFDDRLTAVKINYCPMCGRKLEATK